MLPKIYRTSHPRAPHLVIFTDPQGKKVWRNFKNEGEAKTYHRELLAKAKVVGTVGLVMDQEMRAEYFAARQVLGGESIMTAVRYYLLIVRWACRLRHYGTRWICSSRTRNGSAASPARSPA